MKWDIKEIYEALSIKKSLVENFRFEKISIDSRNLNDKSLFVPIKGEKFDGHHFIDDAASKGVKFSLVEKNKKNLVKDKTINLIEVSDTQESLIKLAKHVRKKNTNFKVICITGSSGKTTLKDWLSQVLNKELNIYSNPGNFNNHIGMPLSLINIPQKTQICILELGMNNYGEIKKLAEIAKPHIAIVTNVGNAHIGNFKNSLEIANEKSDIFKYHNKNSFAIIPGDSKYLSLIQKKAKKKTSKVFTFGENKNCYSQFNINNDNKISFTVSKQKIDLKKKISFKNWEINVSIILVVLKILKLNLRKFEKNLEELKPLSGRGEIKKIKKDKKKFYLVDESYNSSPSALITAIENLNEIKFKLNKKILVIGDMLELGKLSKEMHQKIIPTIIEVQPRLVITVGNSSEIISKNLPKNIKTFHFKKVFFVYNRLIKEIQDNDIVMIKGSNSIKLSDISRRILKG